MGRTAPASGLGPQADGGAARPPTRERRPVGTEGETQAFKPL